MMGDFAFRWVSLTFWQLSLCKINKSPALFSKRLMDKSTLALLEKWGKILLQMTESKQ